LDGLLDGLDAGHVPRLHDEHSRFRCGDAGKLADAHMRAVNVHDNVLDERRGRLAGAHAGEFVRNHLLGLEHLFLGLQ
jgi:hypothetical protein